MLEELEGMLREMKFQCRKCGRESRFINPAEERDRIDRWMPDPEARRELVFYCEHCGSANRIQR